MKTTQQKRLFIDMDGTLYRFHDNILDEEGHVQIDKMYEPDYFVTLNRFENMVDTIRQFEGSNVEVFILSSADRDDIRRQKRKVLKRDLPWIDIHHQLYPPYGENKAEYVERITNQKISKYDTLIDDFNKNLEEWSSYGGNAIKFVNNINHKGVGAYGGDVGNLWRGKYVDFKDPLLYISINERLDPNVKEDTISPCHCDPACVFFDDRQSEVDIIEKKESELTWYWINMLTNPTFQSCKITFSDTNCTQILSNPTDYTKGAFRLTYFDHKMIPNMHEYYSNIQILAEKLANYSIGDVVVHTQSKYATPTLEQTIYRSVYFARSIFEEQLSSIENGCNLSREAVRCLLDSFELHGLTSLYRVTPTVVQGRCQIPNSYTSTKKGTYEEHQWVEIPEYNLSIDISADQFNDKYYQESLAYPPILVQESKFEDRLYESIDYPCHE